MALESDLMGLLLLDCQRVHIHAAPANTKTPYVTWQHIGGDPLDFLDNTTADKRNAQIQINVWHATPLLAFELIQSIEARLRSATAIFIARPLSEPVSNFDDSEVSCGYLQTYSITGAR